MSDVRHEFRVGSRHRHVLLYDPGAIPDDFPADPDVQAREPDAPPESAVIGLADSGRALVVSIPEADCEASVRVLVDEPPEKHLRERGKALVDGAGLSVPSGTLRADGVEFVHRSGESRPFAEGAAMSVPPGVYKVRLSSS